MKQSEKMLIGVAVVVALVMGVPMVVQATGSSKSTDEKIARLKADRQDKEKQAAQILSKTDHLRPQVEALAYNVSSENLRQEIVRKSTALAQKSGVTLVNYRPFKPRSLDVLTEVSVGLHLTGTLSNLVKFLYPLQAPGSRLSVDKIHLSSTNADNEMLDVDLTVSGYTLEVPVEVKTTGARTAT